MDFSRGEKVCSESRNLSPFSWEYKKAASSRLPIPAFDRHSLGARDLNDPVTYQVINCLHIQLGGQPLLHTVDDAEFRIALLHFLEQALRLVEEARVLQGYAHGIGQSLQQADVRIGKGMRVVRK